MEPNIAYNYGQTRMYETVPPRQIVPSTVNDPKKGCSHFNIFITLFTLIMFAITLAIVIFLVVYFTLSGHLEPPQSNEIDNLQSLLYSSNNELNSRLSKANKSIQILQQQNEDILTELHRLLLQNHTQDQSINFEQSNGNNISRACSCNPAGEWTSIANLDMTNFTQQCPAGFKVITRTEPPFRVCGRPDSTVGCASTTFPVFGREYSHVCGKIIAYQFGSPNGFINENIDQFYIAGISLTHGQPRQHIWSFVNARTERAESSACPCTRNDGTFFETIPSFIEDNYFCDTAVEVFTASNGIFYPNDPLWDGQGCGSTSTCCEFNTPPWFCKQLPQPTTDDIEMRLCENTTPNEDDSPFEISELYIS